jgi:hypothetical protein
MGAHPFYTAFEFLRAIAPPPDPIQAVTCKVEISPEDGPSPKTGWYCCFMERHNARPQQFCAPIFPAPESTVVINLNRLIPTFSLRMSRTPNVQLLFPVNSGLATAGNRAHRSHQRH